MVKPEKNSGEGKAAVLPSGLLWGKPGGGLWHAGTRHTGAREERQGQGEEGALVIRRQSLFDGVRRKSNR